LRLDDGRIVKIERDSHTKLPLLEVETVSDRQIDAEEQSEISAIDAWVSVLDSDKQLFQHTHLQPHTTDSVRKLLGSPNERRFNETIKHGMIDGVKGVQPVRSLNRANREDAWLAGKMTQRSVSKSSKRPSGVKLTTMSHIVSDVGELPVRDRSGNKYFVLFKDECTTYRKVYRMKVKSQIVQVWKQFLVDHNHITHDVNGGTIAYRCNSMVAHNTPHKVQTLVTDSDVLYKSDEFKNVSIAHGIGTWLIAPYTHQANPAESSMRRIMEGAVQVLYDSGLPPSFLMDALECHVESENRLYTSVCHDL